MTTKSLHTHPLSPLPTWQGPLPGVGEFAALLNTIQDAAIVVDRESRQLAFGNRGFFELSGYDPLAPDPLRVHRILPEFGEGWSAGEEQETILQTANGRKMEIWLSVHWLDKPGKWLLLRFVPLNVQRWRSSQAQRQEENLDLMEDLAQLTSQEDIESSLALALDAGARLLSAEGLCVYRGDQKQLRRVMVQGNLPQSLPETLPVEEPALTYTPSLWEQRTRPVGALQQAARSAGLASLVSVPINLGESHLGLLVAINPPSQNARQMIDLLATLAGYIAAALNHYLTVRNLERTIRERSRALATRNAIAENSQEGLILLNPTLQLIEINPAAELMLGYSSAETAGMHIENILIGAENLPAALRLARQGLNSPDLGILRLHRRSGQVFPAHLQVFPVKVNGELTNIVLLLRDTSEQEQIRTRTQQLEQRALLGEVTAIFAHEVRNPINNISLSLQLMEMNLPPEDPQRENVSRMQTDCNRITHLMESVLSFAKPMEYKLLPTDLHSLLQKLLERWRPRMTRLNIDLHTQTE